MKDDNTSIVKRKIEELLEEYNCSLGSNERGDVWVDNDNSALRIIKNPG